MLGGAYLKLTLLVLCSAVFISACSNRDEFRGDEWIVAEEPVTKYGVAFTGKTWDRDLDNVLTLVAKFTKEKITSVAEKSGVYEVFVHSPIVRTEIVYTVILQNNHKPAVVDVSRIEWHAVAPEK